MTEIIVEQGGTQVVVQPAVTSQSVVAVAPTTRVEVSQPIATVVELEPTTPQVVEQGVQGPAGPPGPSGNAAVARIALQSLGGHRVVRSVSPTQVDYVDSSDPTHGDDTLGVTEGAAAAGASVNVRTTGSLTFAGWTWTPGEPVFVGSAGVLTQVVPESGFAQVVGFAEGIDTLYVDVQAPIYLI